MTTPTRAQHPTRSTRLQPKRLARRLGLATALGAAALLGGGALRPSGALAQAQAASGGGLRAAALVDSARREIDAAAHIGDLDRLEAAQSLLERVRIAQPGDVPAQRYLALGLYQQGVVRQSRGDTRAASDNFVSAQQELERLVERQPLADDHALLALVYGQLVNADRTRAAEYGRRSAVETQQALRMGPNNPRVWLARGINALYTPPAFGGGVDRAAEFLTKAVELFDADRPAGLDPNWGRADAFVWLGQAYERLQRPADARQAYARALAIDPGFSWVRYSLLPRVARVASEVTSAPGAP